MWNRVCNVCDCPGRIGSASCVQMLNNVVTGSMRWPGRTTGSGPSGASPDSSFARAALSRAASRFDGGFDARASSFSLMRKSGRSAFSRSHSPFFEYSRSSAGARCSARAATGSKIPEAGSPEGDCIASPSAGSARHEAMSAATTAEL